MFTIVFVYVLSPNEAKIRINVCQLLMIRNFYRPQYIHYIVFQLFIKSNKKFATK